MGLLLLLQVLLAAIVARAPAAQAWGKEGHYMTCKIADVREPRTHRSSSHVIDQSCCTYL